MEEGDRDGGADGGGGGGGGGNPVQEIQPGSINQEKLQDGEHPLLNELILKNVFNYVGAGALPQVRLVNTIWHDESLPLWMKLELPIVLSLEDDPTHVFPDLKRHARKAIPMRDFIQSLEAGGAGQEEEEEEASVVARGIKQHHSVFELRAQAAPQPDYNLLESFWSQAGRWMTKLTLWDFVFPDLELVREVVLCLRTPNLEVLDVVITMGKALLANEQVVDVQGEHVKLKTLKIGMLSATWEGNRSRSRWEREVKFPFSWIALLNYYPKLESLTLHTLTAGRYMEQEVWRCLTAIKKLREADDGKLASLKELSWFDEHLFKSGCGQSFDILDGVDLSWGILYLLKRCNLNLTSLGMLRPHPPPIDWISERDFKALLATYRTTLRKFTLFLQQRVPLQLQGLLPSDMTQLQYLCLVGTCPDMTLLKNVPSTVHTLKISDRRYGVNPAFRNSLNAISRTNQEELTGLVLESLKTFCLSQVEDAGWTRGDIIRLAGWMPNLTRLEMKLTNEAFRAVCESLPNLEQLQIFGEALGDKGITGEEVVDVEGDGQQQEVVYEQPNLSSLQKLQSFVIDNPAGEDDERERITEVSVRRGFLNLPCLEKLILRTNWLVTPEAKSLLEEEFSFAKIQIHQQRN